MKKKKIQKTVQKTIKPKVKSKLKSKSKPKPKAKPKPSPKPKAKKVVKPKPTPKPKPKLKIPQEPREGLVTGKKPTDIQLLEQFFAGAIKLKLWKVFSLNTNKEFTLKDLVRLTKTKSDLVIINLKEMMKQGIIEGTKKSILNQKLQKEKAIVYAISKDFPLLPEITQLILTAIPRSAEKVLNELSAMQRLKTVLLSGFFTSKLGLSTPTFSATQSPIDMLLIFEKIPANVTETIAELEHKLGRDLRYAALDQDDFKYRHSIGDKLIRDVLDFEHVVAMDKLSFFK
ncbi:MAG: hypothetical protein V4686_01760 [Patescibacteria group bacterium]